MRVSAALLEPWNKKVGRPKLCGLFRAVEIACTYLRRNGTQEFLHDLRGVSQSTMSRICDARSHVMSDYVEGGSTDVENVIRIGTAAEQRLRSTSGISALIVRHDAVDGKPVREIASLGKRKRKQARRINAVTVGPILGIVHASAEAVDGTWLTSWTFCPASDAGSLS